MAERYPEQRQTGMRLETLDNEEVREKAGERTVDLGVFLSLRRIYNEPGAEWFVDLICCSLVPG